MQRGGKGREGKGRAKGWMERRKEGRMLLARLLVNGEDGADRESLGVIR